MSLKVPDRAGAFIDMAERQPNHIPDPQLAPHEGGNGSPGLPLTIHERAKPPPENTLSRAVERTREIYKRNGWTFLPWGEAGRGSPGVPTLQGEQQAHSSDINNLEHHPLKELPLPFEPNLPSQEHQESNLSVADQVILTKFREASELLGKLPHPLSQEFKDAMTERAVEEVWRELYPELKRQADQLDDQLDEDIMEALQDPIQRKKLLEDD
jgi:hypothetical protein